MGEIKSETTAIEVFKDPSSEGKNFVFKTRIFQETKNWFATNPTSTENQQKEFVEKKLALYDDAFDRGSKSVVEKLDMGEEITIPIYMEHIGSFERIYKRSPLDANVLTWKNKIPNGNLTKLIEISQKLKNKGVPSAGFSEHLEDPYLIDYMINEGMKIQENYFLQFSRLVGKINNLEATAVMFLQYFPNTSLDFTFLKREDRKLRVKGGNIAEAFIEKYVVKKTDDTNPDLLKLMPQTDQAIDQISNLQFFLTGERELNSTDSGDKSHVVKILNTLAVICITNPDFIRKPAKNPYFNVSVSDIAKVNFLIKDYLGSKSADNYFTKLNFFAYFILGMPFEGEAIGNGQEDQKRKKLEWQKWFEEAGISEQLGQEFIFNLFIDKFQNYPLEEFDESDRNSDNKSFSNKSFAFNTKYSLKSTSFPVSEISLSPPHAAIILKKKEPEKPIINSILSSLSDTEVSTQFSKLEQSERLKVVDSVLEIVTSDEYTINKIGQNPARTPVYRLLRLLKIDYNTREHAFNSNIAPLDYTSKIRTFDPGLTRYDKFQQRWMVDVQKYAVDKIMTAGFSENQPLLDALENEAKRPAVIDLLSKLPLLPEDLLGAILNKEKVYRLYYFQSLFKAAQKGTIDHDLAYLYGVSYAAKLAVYDSLERTSKYQRSLSHNIKVNCDEAYIDLLRFKPGIRPAEIQRLATSGAESILNDVKKDYFPQSFKYGNTESTLSLLSRFQGRLSLLQELVRSMKKH